MTQVRTISKTLCRVQVEGRKWRLIKTGDDLLWYEEDGENKLSTAGPSLANGPIVIPATPCGVQLAVVKALIELADYLTGVAEAEHMAAESPLELRRWLLNETDLLN